MKKLILLITAIIFFSCSKERESIQVDEYQKCKEYVESFPEMTPDMANPETGLIQGDILPDLKHTRKGNIFGDLDRRWKNKIVAYYYKERTTYERDGETITSPGFSKEQQEVFDIYIQEIAEKLNFTVIKYDNLQDLKEDFRDGVRIEPGLFGGASHLGRQGGIQELQLGYGSGRYTTYHEWWHTLAGKHEQQRSDRNKFIVVHYDNIKEFYHDQYDKDSTSVSCGDFYDFMSISNYPSYFEDVAIDSTKPVATKLNGDTWERAKDFSKGDKETVDILYN